MMGPDRRACLCCCGAWAGAGFDDLALRAELRLGEGSKGVAEGVDEGRPGEADMGDEQLLEGEAAGAEAAGAEAADEERGGLETVEARSSDSWWAKKHTLDLKSIG